MQHRPIQVIRLNLTHTTVSFCAGRLLDSPERIEAYSVHLLGSWQQSVVVKNHVAIWLWEEVGKAEVLAQEWQQFGRGSVVSKVFCLHTSFIL